MIQIKSISSKAEEFVPSSQRDAGPDERPLTFLIKRMSREDKYNLQGLVDSEVRNGEVAIKNIGEVSRYIWKHCVLEVRNVSLDTGFKDSMRGPEKNSLFDSEGMDEEIMEAINQVQRISTFTEDEAKN